MISYATKTTQDINDAKIAKPFATLNFLILDWLTTMDYAYVSPNHQQELFENSPGSS